MKALAAGDLRTPVFLGRPVVVKDATGAETLTWSELSTWAAIEPLTGREWQGATAVKDAVDIKLKIRLTDGWIPSARWRIRDAVSDAIYNVVAVMPDGQHGAAVCLAKSVQGNSDGR